MAMFREQRFMGNIVTSAKPLFSKNPHIHAEINSLYSCNDMQVLMSDKKLTSSEHIDHLPCDKK